MKVLFRFVVAPPLYTRRLEADDAQTLAAPARHPQAPRAARLQTLIAVVVPGVPEIEKNVRDFRTLPISDLAKTADIELDCAGGVASMKMDERYLLLLLTAFLVAVPAFGSKNKDIEGQLRNGLQNKMLHMRGLPTVIILSTGEVGKISIARPIGLGLDEQAVECVRRWRFHPAIKDGKPVSVAVNVEVAFNLY